MVKEVEKKGDQTKNLSSWMIYLHDGRIGVDGNKKKKKLTAAMMLYVAGISLLWEVSKNHQQEIECIF